MDPLYKDPSASIDARLDDLLPRLDADELLAQLSGFIVPYGGTMADGRPATEAARDHFTHGIGTVSYACMGTQPSTSPATVNALQRILVEETRLGIPALFCEECFIGHVALGATCFPSPANIAASFDPAFVETVVRAVAAEVTARGGSMVHWPVADLARDPRWGRSNESFSEDPTLAGAMVAAAVRGLQGGPGGPRPGALAATIKHFAGFAQSAGGRQMGPVDCGPTTFLNEILPPFREGVEAGAAGIMPAYPEIDGTPCHASHWLLTDVLRRRWGFQGVVTADYGGVDKLVHSHHVAETNLDAALMALFAGVDMDLPEGRSYPLLRGRLATDASLLARIRTSVARVLRLKLQLGLFDTPYASEERARITVGSPAHRELTRLAAERGIVLLRNENATLPLDRTRTRRIALIGPHARLPHLGDDRPGRVTIDEGLRAVAGPGIEIRFAQGCRLTTKDEADVTYLAETAGQGLTELQRIDVDPAVARLFADQRPRLLPPGSEDPLIAEAARAARDCDVAVLCLGDSQHAIGENYSPTRRGDRDEIGLIGNQVALLQAVRATGVPTVVLLVHGRALALGDVVHLADAIVDLWDPGEARGTAAARILFGDAEPGGRLPFSIPLTSGAIPCHYGQRPLGYTREYAFRDDLVAFPFGHGLTWTTFTLGNPVAMPATIQAGSPGTVHVTVRNTGHRAGTAVVQAYLNDCVSSVTRPERFLVAWQRVHLEAGAQAPVTLHIPPRAFAFHDATGTEQIEAGRFRVGVGLDSASLTWTDLDVTPP